MHINERQRRSDEPTANAVARGLNILTVRDAELARRYMAGRRAAASRTAATRCR